MTSQPPTGTKPPKPRTIALEKVEALAETRNVRLGATFLANGVDRDHVARMLPLVADLPPIDVVALNGGRYGILAGYHRVRAHNVAARKNIRALVHDLPVEEWFPFAVRSNIAHGLPLTTAERKAAAKRMLDDGDKRSDRAIAADCGIDHKTVGKLRHPEAEATGEVPQLIPMATPRGQTKEEFATKRVGLDGKTRTVPPPTPIRTMEELKRRAKIRETLQPLVAPRQTEVVETIQERIKDGTYERMVQQAHSADRLRPAERALDDRWVAWVNDLNHLMAQGDRLQEESDNTEGLVLGGHSAIALMIYKLMVERVPAELSRFYEQEGN